MRDKIRVKGNVRMQAFQFKDGLRKVQKVKNLKSYVKPCRQSIVALEISDYCSQPRSKTVKLQSCNMLDPSKTVMHLDKTCISITMVRSMLYCAHTSYVWSSFKNRKYYHLKVPRHYRLQCGGMTKCYKI